MRISGAVKGSGFGQLLESAYRTPEGDWARSGIESARAVAASRIFEDITRTFEIAFVPDVFAGMRGRPAYLEATWELFQEDVGLHRMDRQTRRIVALAVTTNEAGIHFITAYPQAFRLTVDSATCDKVAYFIWLVTAFERFLSGVNFQDRPRAVQFVTAHWREEYYSDGAGMAIVPPLSKGDKQEAASWMGKAVVTILVLAILAIGAFLVLL